MTQSQEANILNYVKREGWGVIWLGCPNML